MDLLYFSDLQLRRKPQRGTPCDLTWEQFAEWLSEPIWGDDKEEGGGYSPGKYDDDIRRLDHLLSVGVLVFDVDINGEVPRIAEAMKGFSCIIHETFSSTAESRRCRLLVQLKDPIEGALYSAVHRLFRAQLTKHPLNIWPDENATDASRLSFFPVRRKGAGYGFATTKGDPVDGKTIAAAVTWNTPRNIGSTPQHPNDESDGPAGSATKQYIESAVESARHNLSIAKEGDRHHVLLKEAFGLSRPYLGLTYDQVVDALLETAIARMGQYRAHEAKMAIRDAFTKRRGGG
jgi:hypothetical protein